VKLRNIDLEDWIRDLVLVGVIAFLAGVFAFLGWHILKALALLAGCP